VEKVFHF